ncbi:MAG: hypothetical protein HY814_03890 [Candidatus Riflebacteria bacterium]|nr:hypothetical protein [Candidatus Riflebacteria bacterium]
MGSKSCRSVTFALVVSLAALAWAGAAVASGVPERFALANVTSDSATVVWLSADVEAGRVEFAESGEDLAARTGTYALATDDAGPGRAHHVTLGEAALFDNRLSSGRPPLRSSTIYFFDVLSGGTRFDNDGAHFQLRTAPASEPRFVTPEPATVAVQGPGGSLPAEAFVKYRLSSTRSTARARCSRGRRASWTWRAPRRAACR